MEPEADPKRGAGKAHTGWDAERYDRSSTPQRQWGALLVDSIDGSNVEHALDAGCGTGRLTLELAERLPDAHIVALDADASMMAKAKENLSDLVQGGRMELVHSDFLKYDPDEPFDLVFSNAVFQWIDDDAALWRRCWDLLRPGGRLVAECAGAGNLGPQKALAEQIAAEIGEGPETGRLERGARYAEIEPTRRGLEEAGFEAAEVGFRPEEPEFDSDEAFDDFARAVVLRPYEGQISPKLWESFTSQWIERHVEIHGRRLHYIRLRIRARRPE